MGLIGKLMGQIAYLKAEPGVAPTMHRLGDEIWYPPSAEICVSIIAGGGASEWLHWRP
jgi:hypothetical protein